MAYNKPIVATNVGGVSEVVRDGINGFLVPSKAHKLMADKIITLLKDDNLRNQMGKEGFSILKDNFSEESMIRKLESLYSSLLETRTPS